MSEHRTGDRDLGRWLSAGVSRLLLVLEAVAFWTAIVLPFALLPVLAFGGGRSPAILLVSVNLACLFVGHRYRPSADGVLEVRLRQMLSGRSSS